MTKPESMAASATGGWRASNETRVGGHRDAPRGAGHRVAQLCACRHLRLLACISLFGAMVRDVT